MAASLATDRIAVAGAGSIGCYLGGLLAAEGRTVRLLARPALVEAIAARGLVLSDLTGRSLHAGAERLNPTSDPAEAFRDARVILVTVKSGDTATMAALIKAHAPEDAIVVSFQNGIGNVQILGKELARERLVPGMVPFNVTQTTAQGSAPRFHRGTSGSLHIARRIDGLAALLATPGLACMEHEDMRPVAWSKLVLNLNNALNALSGLTLYDQLSDRSWRLQLAGQMDEAIAIIRASGVKLVKIDGVHPALAPHVLRLPDMLFRLVAKQMLSIDRKARSSMAEDLERGRKTEIDYLQGAVVSAAEKLGLDAPKCREVIRRVKEREATSSSGTHPG